MKTKDFKQQMSDEINYILKQDHINRGLSIENWENGDYTKLNSWELNRIYVQLKNK